MTDHFTVEALSLEGELKYRWSSKLIAHEDDLYVLYGAWNRGLEQADGAEVPVTNQSIEFYWAELGFTISAIYDDAGALQEYYGRTISQVEVDEHSKVLRFCLLGSDLQVAPSFKYDIVSAADEAEGDAPDAGNDGWMELFMLLERREGPFDPVYLKRFEELSELSK